MEQWKMLTAIKVQLAVWQDCQWQFIGLVDSGGLTVSTFRYISDVVSVGVSLLFRDTQSAQQR